MKLKRIKRLVDIQERVHRAKRGLLAHENQRLRLAQEEHQQVQTRREAHRNTLGTPREWDPEHLPGAAQMVALADGEVESAQRVVHAHEDLVRAAAEEVRAAGYELRRYELLAERARELFKRTRNRRDQASTDEVAGQRWWRNDGQGD